MARWEVVVAPPVVVLLIHQPVAIYHIAWLAVRQAVAVHDVVAVVHQLVIRALEVLPLIDPYPVRASVLLVKGGEETLDR